MNYYYAEAGIGLQNHNAPQIIVHSEYGPAFHPSPELVTLINHFQARRRSFCALLVRVAAAFRVAKVGKRSPCVDGTILAKSVARFHREDQAMDVSSSNSRYDEAGLSVLEIAAVVMIFGIITSMSIVMFSGGKARYELSTRAQKMSWQIEHARSLAIKYNQTLTVGFGQDGSFGLTCTDCATAKSELSSIVIPSNITLSSRPTLTIKGNGTISGGSTIKLTDTGAREVTVSIANSGRVSVGSITQATVNH